eukprot:TRINITY_DN48603_c0_g1_i1.p1 TRINITY_DN48603_c0_g1~~TRINITY_DN48603_c0_g1_i1.p1  ORF type:complete len:414 (+),score=70.78 TRINITY_DN48603_c0_g1_i1:35-1243(+)
MAFRRSGRRLVPAALAPSPPMPMPREPSRVAQRLPRAMPLVASVPARAPRSGRAPPAASATAFAPRSCGAAAALAGLLGGVLQRRLTAGRTVARGSSRQLAGGRMLSTSAAAAKQANESRLPIALCQLAVGPDKATNLRGARAAIEAAADRGARFVVLPECWNCPYGGKYFDRYAEAVPGVGGVVEGDSSPSVALLVELARKRGIYICGGSNPEREGGKLYNAGVVVDDQGAIISKYRKVHLFDIDIPGKMTFKESDTLTAGSEPNVFDTPWGKMGVAICYDMRFPELAMLMRARGAKVLLYPGAFNTTTGPKHYELLARARAVDNQCFVIACSPARVPGFEYQAWGHSTVVDPWAEVVATCEHEPCTLHTELDFAQVEAFRENVPISKQKRPDIYRLEAVS